jgi:hypothetical protein
MRLPARTTGTMLTQITCGSPGERLAAGRDNAATGSQRRCHASGSAGRRALNDHALIDTYHQAADDHRAARAEGSDNLSKAYADARGRKGDARSVP